MTKKNIKFTMYKENIKIHTVEGRTLTYNGLLFLNCYLDGELSHWHSHHIFLYLLCVNMSFYKNLSRNQKFLNIE